MATDFEKHLDNLLEKQPRLPLSTEGKVDNKTIKQNIQKNADIIIKATESHINEGVKKGTMGLKEALDELAVLSKKLGEIGAYSERDKLASSLAYMQKFADSQERMQKVANQNIIKSPLETYGLGPENLKKLVQVELGKPKIDPKPTELVSPPTLADEKKDIPKPTEPASPPTLADEKKDIPKPKEQVKEDKKEEVKDTARHKEHKANAPPIEPGKIANPDAPKKHKKPSWFAKHKGRIIGGIVLGLAVVAAAGIIVASMGAATPLLVAAAGIFIAGGLVIGGGASVLAGIRADGELARNTVLPVKPDIAEKVEKVDELKPNDTVVKVISTKYDPEKEYEDKDYLAALMDVALEQANLHTPGYTGSITIPTVKKDEEDEEDPLKKVSEKKPQKPS